MRTGLRAVVSRVMQQQEQQIIIMIIMTKTITKTTVAAAAGVSLQKKRHSLHTKSAKSQHDNTHKQGAMPCLQSAVTHDNQQ